MNYLRKMFWCLGLVILIQLLKKLLDSVFPQAILFHHFLLSGVQVAILIWTIIILLLPGKSFIKKLFILIFILAIPELLFTYWIHHPSQIPSSLNSTFQHYYSKVEANIIQFDPRTGVYDSGLFYTLKPSSRFVFKNSEFEDSSYTNKMGLRDDDSSLIKPDIICLGDSYAMGWGVKQNETFAELLAGSTKKKVLNAAVASFGTAREIKSLDRFDTSNLQYIIIQYCRNDYTENKNFVENNYSLRISPKTKYDTLVNEHWWNKLWFPGKRFITISKFYAEKKLAGYFSFKKDTAAENAARYFTDILLHSSINFKKTKVLVVDLSEKERMNNDFVTEVKTLMELPVYKERFNNNLIMVPVADLFTKEDYYILDTHLRASGHRKVAERLGKYIF